MRHQSSYPHAQRPLFRSTNPCDDLSVRILIDVMTMEVFTNFQIRSIIRLYFSESFALNVISILRNIHHISPSS